MFGAEGVILNLSRELNEFGHKNHIVCLRNTKNPHTELVDAAHTLGLNAEAVDCKGRIDFKAIKEIRAIIDEKNIQVIHCHDYKANMHGVLAAPANVKKIATNHLWTSETMLLRLYEIIDGVMANSFHRVIGVSDKITIQVRRYLLDKKRAQTIYNGIDLDYYRSDGKATGVLRTQSALTDKHFVLGAVGRLSVQKGYPYLLQALKLLKEEFPQLRLIFVGDGDQREKLQAEVKRLGLENMVYFAGIQKNMLDVYRSVDVLTMSSIAEGLPLVLLEALAMRLPVVATKVGAIGKVIDNRVTGLLCEAADVKVLAQQIRCVILDENLRQTITANGRKLMEEKLSSEAMARQYEQVYNEVLNN